MPSIKLNEYSLFSRTKARSAEYIFLQTVILIYGDYHLFGVIEKLDHVGSYLGINYFENVNCY